MSDNKASSNVATDLEKREFVMERIFDAPRELVTFADHNGQTKLTSRSQFASAADLQTTLDMGMAEGMADTFDRLADYLEELR
jgi:uncharacterized protein YndB with AHSA1/START domain